MRVAEMRSLVQYANSNNCSHTPLETQPRSRLGRKAGLLHVSRCIPTCSSLVAHASLNTTRKISHLLLIPRILNAGNLCTRLHAASRNRRLLFHPMITRAYATTWDMRQFVNSWCRTLLLCLRGRLPRHQAYINLAGCTTSSSARFPFPSEPRAVFSSFFRFLSAGET